MFFGDRFIVLMNFILDKIIYGSYVCVYDDEKFFKLCFFVSIYIDGDLNSDVIFNDIFNIF